MGWTIWYEEAGTSTPDRIRRYVESYGTSTVLLLERVRERHSGDSLTWIVTVEECATGTVTSYVLLTTVRPAGRGRVEFAVKDTSYPWRELEPQQGRKTARLLMRRWGLEGLDGDALETAGVLSGADVDAVRWVVEAAAAPSPPRRPVVRAGDVVDFGRTLKFSGGTEGSMFEFEKGSTFHVPGQPWSRVRIPNWRRGDWKVVDLDEVCDLVSAFTD